MQFSFREVDKKDEKLLFDWRNDPITRRWSFDDKPILFVNHQKYLKEKILDKKCLMWIFLLNNEPCGLVRLNIEDKKIILNYLISEKYRGQKLSSIMLILARKKICKLFPKVDIYAYTLPENVVSIKSLQRAGFTFKGSEINKKIYLYKCV